MFTALFEERPKRLLGLIETDSEGRFIRSITTTGTHETLQSLQLQWERGLPFLRGGITPDGIPNTMLDKATPSEPGFSIALRYWALDRELLPVELSSDRRDQLTQTLKLPLSDDELYAFFQALRDASTEDLVLWKELAPSNALP